MQLPISKRSAALFAALVTALGIVVGAAVGTAASPAVPANPFAADLAAIKGLSIKGGFPGNPRDTKLHQLALSEGGQVTVYTSVSSFITKPLQAAWAAAFPDITLNLYRAASADVFTRFVNESRAGIKGADVVETDATTMGIFQHDKNLIVPYRKNNPYSLQIPAQYRFDAFTADRLEMFAVAWNKNLVTNPPTTLQQLEDPSWKGKIALEPTDFDWFARLYQYYTTEASPKMTGAQVDDMFKKIAANAQLIPGHSAEASALAAGQVSLVVNGHVQSMEQLMAKNAPISFGPPFVNPVVQRPQGMALAYTASHPAAGLLFYDFMLSPVGQKMLLNNGVYPSNPYYFDSAFKADPSLHVIKIDVRPIIAHYQAWEQHWNSIVGG